MMFADNDTAVSGNKRSIDDVDLILRDRFRETADEGCKEWFRIDLCNVAFIHDIEMLMLNRVMLRIQITHFLDEGDIRLKTLEFLRKDYRRVDCGRGELPRQDGEDLLGNI